MTITTVNPANEETLETYQEMSAGQIEAMVHKADAAFQTWRRVGLGDKAARLRKLAVLLRTGAQEYAILMAEEMGKPSRDIEMKSR